MAIGHKPKVVTPSVSDKEVRNIANFSCHFFFKHSNGIDVRNTCGGHYFPSLQLISNWSSQIPSCEEIKLKGCGPFHYDLNLQEAKLNTKVGMQYNTAYQLLYKAG